MPTANISPEEIKLILEWAGQRLLTLRVANLYPQSYRSFWPDYPDEKFTAYGYTNTSLRPPPPAADEIPQIDAILNLILQVPDLIQRRVLNARCLVSPVNGRYIYPWTKIALMIDTHPKTVRIIHKRGLVAITKTISVQDVGRFRAIVGLN